MVAKGKNYPRVTGNSLVNDEMIEKIISFLDTEILNANMSEVTGKRAMDIFASHLHGIFNIDRDYNRLKTHLIGLCEVKDYDPYKEDVQLSRHWADELFLKMKNLPKEEIQRITERLEDEGII